MSPPPMTAGGESLMEGNVNTLKPLSGIAFDHHRRLGRIREGVGDRGGVIGLQGALSATGDVVLVPIDLCHLLERVLDRLVGPRDFVAGQLVVHVWSGSTPASWKTGTLYQTVDLFRPLKKKP